MRPTGGRPTSQPRRTSQEGSGHAEAGGGRAARPPSVDRVLSAARPRLGPREHGPVLAAARDVVAEEREQIRRGRRPRTAETLASELVERLDAFAAAGGTSSLAPVINATGVILHTNLGRASWAPAAIDAAVRAAADPLLLEMDAETGRRGRRARTVEEHLVALTGAEDALVTTNNAAALAVAVGLAGRRAVAVSRGELVEIGGGVRIPEIVRRAGARLVEVGTTNRTRASDFAEPLASGRVAVVLRVHPSNFRMEGFVERPDPVELATLAHAHGAVVVDDLGSGALLDTAAFGLAHEPTPAESLAAGADLVTFSGDKLLGGPQAGLVVGRADLVARLRRDPLARATRPDKTIVAALAATLGLYRAGLAAREIPVWRAIAAPVAELAGRAQALAVRVSQARSSAVPAAEGPAGDAGVRADAMRATIGGGALPGETLPSAGLVVEAAGGDADALLAALRLGEPAVIARTADGAVLLDLRAVPEEADDALVGALLRALAAGGPRPSRRAGGGRRA